MNSSKHALARTDSQVIDGRSTPTVMTQPAPAWMDSDGQRPSSIASYLEIPFIHKRVILLSTLVGILLGWGALLLWPRSYESAAKLMIRVGRESVSLDPTATTSATLMLQKTREEEIVSALEILNSRKVAESVVDKLGSDAILNGQVPGDPVSEARGGSMGNAKKASSIADAAKSALSDSVRSALLTAGVKDEVSDREVAVRRIQSTVWITSPRKSNVIVIRAKSSTPEMAQLIVEKVTEAFMDEHLRGGRTDGSFDFFEGQSDEVEKQLDDLVAQRSKFMQENDIVSIDANRNLLQQRIAGIDRDLIIATGDLEQAVSQIEDLEEKAAATDDEIVASKLAAEDSTWSGMRQQVYELELTEERLAAKSTDDHPKLREVREQLNGAREILDKLKSERVEQSTTPNPVKIRLNEELQRQETRAVGLRSMIAKKETQRLEMERQTKQLLEQERELTQMDRNIRLMNSSLQLMRDKLEEARVIDELYSNKISNVHVFQPATFVERPVSPKKKFLAAGFLFLGLMSGLGLSLIRQASSSVLRTSEDIESQLGCPVVSTIPQLSKINSPRLKEQTEYRGKCQALVADVLLTQCEPRQTRGRSLGIIGADVGAGASTLAANLAAASAVDCRMQTVLVDADSRTRSLSKMFGLNGRPGLVELVGGSASHDECLQQAKHSPIELIASAADSCDEILTASAPEVVQALQAYQDDCDLLIVDLPPSSQPDQAVAIAQHLDCVLVVVESEKTQTANAERLLRRLSESDTQLVGVVLNKTRNYLPRWLQRSLALKA